MLILLTNDDGIYAPGLAAMEKTLRRLGDVEVVSPATEQSGVGHSITFRTPLLYKQVLLDDENHWGWAVEGTPADCVKIGVSHICDRKPDLVVSGINGGLNAGINVLYSGTVAAAVEASFYRIDSFAVSMEFRDKIKLPFDRAAEIAVDVIEKVLSQKKKTGNTSPELYNLNIPLQAIDGERALKIVPMDPNQYWDAFEKRTDPSGKPYFWLVGRPIPKRLEDGAGVNGVMTDLQALALGFVTLTPLDYDMTKRESMPMLESLGE